MLDSGADQAGGSVARRPGRERFHTVGMLIRIEGSDLPGLTCGPGADFPGGHDNIHVAVQGRKGQQDLFGLVPGDVPVARWDLHAAVASPSPLDLRGPQIQGGPGRRFIYLSWGVVGHNGSFTMFRRAKIWLDAVPGDVQAAALGAGRLVGRMGLSDTKGGPVCAAVRPPRIVWSA
jgi:hypothetical protein